jgi:hypothetical protein
LRNEKYCLDFGKLGFIVLIVLEFIRLILIRTAWKLYSMRTRMFSDKW